MRKFNNILLAASLLFMPVLFTSCESDDANESVTVIETTRIKNVGYTEATCVSYIKGSYSKRGVSISLSSSMSDSKSYEAVDKQAESEILISGLDDATTYYVATYAVCNGKMVYSPSKSFTTISMGDPLVKMADITDVTYSTVKFEGFVMTDGGHAISERGFCYAVDPDPSVENATVIKVAGGLGRMAATVGDLKDNSTYHMRGFVKSGDDYFYTEDMPFATKEYERPSMSIVDIYDLKIDRMTIKAKLTALNDLAITERGVRYSKSEDVATGVDVPSDATTEEYVLTISGLEQGVTYYIWAYGTNSKGRAYSPMSTMQTLSELPVVKIKPVENVVGYSALGGIEIVGLGIQNAPITDAGVCWSTSATPTVDDAHISAVNPAMGSFTGLRMGLLKPETLYYARAYATNKFGTSYSWDINFTTAADLFDSNVRVGAAGAKLPMFNAWQIIVGDPGKTNNVSSEFIQPAFKTILDNVNLAFNACEGRRLLGFWFNPREATDGPLYYQIALYHYTASNSMVATYIDFQFEGRAEDGTFVFKQHRMQTSMANLYNKVSPEHQASFDAFFSYFEKHRFYLDWATPGYRFGDVMDAVSGPIHMIPVDEPQNYWTFTSKNIAAGSIKPTPDPWK